MSLADLMPKVDISGQIKSYLIKELGDKLGMEDQRRGLAESERSSYLILLFRLRCKVL